MPFGRVLLEPVRSAEPPIISGTAVTSLRARVPTRCAWRCPWAQRELLLLERLHGLGQPGDRQLAAIRRSNSARLSAAILESRFCQ